MAYENENHPLTYLPPVSNTVQVMIEFSGRYYLFTTANNSVLSNKFHHCSYTCLCFIKSDMQEWPTHLHELQLAIVLFYILA